MMPPILRDALKTTFWVYCPHMMQQVVRDALLEYPLTLLSPYDTTNCMRCFLDYLQRLLSSYDTTNSIRRSSWQPSLCVVLIWVCCFDMMPQIVRDALIDLFWACYPNMMPQTVWKSCLEYLLSLLFQYDATNSTKLLSRVPAEFIVPILCYRLVKTFI